MNSVKTQSELPGVTESPRFETVEVGDAEFASLCAEQRAERVRVLWFEGPWRRSHLGSWRCCIEAEREKWGWSKPYCTQLITASKVVRALPETVAIATESQARELAKVEPEKRVKVIEKATAKAESQGRKLTARDIREQVEKKTEVKTANGEIAAARTGAFASRTGGHGRRARVGGRRRSRSSD